MACRGQQKHVLGVPARQVEVDRAIAVDVACRDGVTLHAVNTLMYEMLEVAIGGARRDR